MVAVTIRVDKARRQEGPIHLVRSLRTEGSSNPHSTAERVRLRWVIHLVDRCFPSGPNCYRRVLVEIAMDAGAAAEPLHLGIQADGGFGSGHAWLASERPIERYDASFVV